MITEGRILPLVLMLMAVALVIVYALTVAPVLGWMGQNPYLLTPTP